MNNAYNITAYDKNRNQLWIGQISPFSRHWSAQDSADLDVACLSKALTYISDKTLCLSISPDTGLPNGKRVKIAYFVLTGPYLATEYHVTKYGREVGIRDYHLIGDKNKNRNVIMGEPDTSALILDTSSVYPIIRYSSGNVCARMYEDDGMWFILGDNDESVRFHTRRRDVTAIARDAMDMITSSARLHSQIGLAW